MFIYKIHGKDNDEAVNLSREPSEETTSGIRFHGSRCMAFSSDGHYFAFCDGIACALFCTVHSALRSFSIQNGADEVQQWRMDGASEIRLAADIGDCVRTRWQFDGDMGAVWRCAIVLR